MAINLGNIFFGIVPNLTGLNAAANAVRNFGGAFTGAMGNVANAARQFQANAGAAATQGNNLAGTFRTLAQSSTLIAGPLSGIATRLNVVGTLMNSTSVLTAAFVVGMAGAGFAVYQFSQAAV